MLSQLIQTLPALIQPSVTLNLDKVSEALSHCPDQSDTVYSDLIRVLAGSDYVADQLSRSPMLLAELQQHNDLYRAYPADEYQQQLSQRLKTAENEEQLHHHLRQYRQREMVRIIWRDLTRTVDMRATTADLSALADACIDEALQWLYNDCCSKWGTPHSSPSEGQPSQPQQLVVLGMGKLGAHELNLSSDIDLIFAYPEKGMTEGGRRVLANQDFFSRLGQKLIQALDNITADGFVFRTDMRLRPYGASGPLVCSFSAMEDYYQTQGRDWERYAMIKARVVAGNQQAGAELLEMLRPFVYRKYIDFSAFDSLRSMKEMINKEVRRKGLQGNVKLGAGGIREVEFIAQAFQLIRGGRDPRLQQRELLNILPLLPETMGIPAAAINELTEAYTFLRNAEHVIQAVADRQTQELPMDAIGQARMAFSMGFDDWDSFITALVHQRSRVTEHFADVIAPAETNPQQDDHNSDWLLLWNSEFETEEGEAFFAQHGLDNPQQAWQAFNHLKSSRSVQVMQAIGHERLLAVLPKLMTEISAVDNASETLERVLLLIQAIIRRSSYLVLLAENPDAMKQLVRLCSASAWFSETLTKQPVLLDELIDQRSLYSPPSKDTLQSDLRQQLLRIPEEDEEQLMDTLRYFKSAHVLSVAASDITGALPLMKVSDYLTWLAEVILDVVLDIAWRQLSDKHGVPMKSPSVPCDPDFIIVGYGKLGGIELSYGSDLDLVFIHDADASLYTEGKKPIANSVFFTRLGQKIIHILNTFTTGGDLYEVDMRLRPSGKSGLLVSSLKAFSEYQEKEAWTWEHQALVRARVITGSASLKAKFEQVRSDVLSRPRDLTLLASEVIQMREKMRDHLGTSEKDSDTLFNLKQDRGGIVDIEFIVQYSALAFAHQYPELIEYTDNIRILDAMEKTGVITEGDAQTLREAYKDYRSVGHRQVLQGRTNSVSANELEEYRQEVIRIWKAQLDA
ncbi:bifunctional [glutamate--ammonia ligase]-adenylyl-L-tyrosine phosphorylase/[glutamate--ammonia-ligase] adenylyltransferase [Amphritea sp. 2_MG-2023]|uniref:bifunctional [glutamate--ammonia ligase]-adenylyl-L-tyrosine phosphorylase/[glutamate--ammonia-ligase] adenylyltransferase n=1 Tax=Amphritea TaxID=515417 RepID=UPI001C06E295|nr:MULTISPECIES: bifunctional [glutamate--ammonia ligase]-adenylyl-L-tyrosine phosphorylase/[glutamate--ammonia-ligase] adenylyltransferase [Amphritea]MBU2965665.1 bifunctional [glutamate--ammonia ligase]-adenylyl-L-tyrosine phosphorylase/[glutamate--ammonia-ligase] adenylyltransferase [Amphritea atlantica]MDO6417221.1 bifunctional [glutamate--ammonia ligase]-adenylyl-L-tyrosine phosphorylase/[glutamate--ammonia-ligase] adenylyltransferase [Amphritea sp. 2_MG-2023]